MAMLLFSMVAGSTLEGSIDLLTSIPTIILAVPAFINLAGDLAGVFTARVTSALFVGLIDNRFRPYSVLMSNLLGVMLVALGGFSFLGFALALVNESLGIAALNGSAIFTAILVSGMITTVTMAVLGLWVAYTTFSRGLNPDNFTSPLTTSLGDALGTLLLVGTIRFLVIPPLL